MKHEIEGILRKHSQLQYFQDGLPMKGIPACKLETLAEEIEEFIEQQIEIALDDYKSQGELHG